MRATLSLAYLAVVAAAVALSISSRPLVPRAGLDKLAVAILDPASLERRLKCAESGHRFRPNLDTLALTVAFTETESYARPAWVRQLKHTYLAAYLWVVGELPDISIGPAQLKIRNISRITKWPTAELAARIADDCDNLSIAYCLVSELRKERPLTPENVAAIARAYNGQRGSAELDGSRQYIDLVARIFAIARGKLVDRRADQGDTSTQGHICL